MTLDDRERIAEAFARARREGTSLSRYPGPMPDSLDEAYAIQRRAVELLGLPVLGWKIARLSDAEAERWGVPRIFGPVCRMWDCGEGEAQVPLISGGYSAAEAEIQLQLGAGAAEPGAATAPIGDLVDSIRLGIEVAGSPYRDINAHGAAVTISDFGNNLGIVLGSRCGPRTAISSLLVRSTLDERTVGSGSVGETPFEALVFLSSEAPRRGWTLKPGQWVSSGAITGAHPVAPGQHFAAIAELDSEVIGTSASFASN